MRLIALCVAVLALGSLNGCSVSGNLTRSNTCHAKCFYEEKTHSFVQVGQFCYCKPAEKK